MIKDFIVEDESNISLLQDNRLELHSNENNVVFMLPKGKQPHRFKIITVQGTFDTPIKKFVRYETLWKEGDRLPINLYEHQTGHEGNRNIEVIDYGEIQIQTADLPENVKQAISVLAEWLKQIY